MCLLTSFSVVVHQIFLDFLLFTTNSPKHAAEEYYQVQLGVFIPLMDSVRWKEAFGKKKGKWLDCRWEDVLYVLKQELGGN